MRHLQKYKRKRTLSDWPTATITFVAALLCWFVSWRQATGLPIAPSVVFLPPCKWINLIFAHDIIAYITGMFMYLLIAFIVQRINDHAALINGWNCLPLLLFVLFVSTNAELHPLTATTLVMFCLLFVLNALFATYQSPESFGLFFNVGILIGLAGLLTPQTLWFVPFSWLGMYRFRSLSLKSAWVLLVGTLTVYWIWFGWCVWTHDFSTFVLLGNSLIDFGFISIDSLFTSRRIFVLALLITVFISMKLEGLECGVAVRRKLQYLLDLSFWSLLLTFIYGDANIEALWALIYLPASLLVAGYLERLRSNYFRFIFYYVSLTYLFISYMAQTWNGW